VRDGITVELWEDAPDGSDVGGVCDDPLAEPSMQLEAGSSTQCDTVPLGSYQLGLDGVPAGWTVSVSCTQVGPEERIDEPGAFFVVNGSDPVTCNVFVGTPILAIDKVVNGGDAIVADFEFEVYDDGGSLVDLPVPAIVDPDASMCSSALTECVLVPVPAGEYQLGEILPEYGYAVGSVTCDSFINLDTYFDEPVLKEIIPGDDASFRTDDGDAYCVVTNDYQEGQLVVTATVTNDEGGTATPADISVEVYELASDTPLVAATACAADGSCLDMMLPTGDYAIGYTGPDGYTREITQTVTAPVEKVTDDPDANFTMSAGDLVEIVVAIDDPTPTTTTTTTTTTLVTTTSIDAGVVTLPQTGSSESNQALLALALVGAGGALLLVRRRGTV